jgi:hypothetical protein
MTDPSPTDQTYQSNQINPEPTRTGIIGKVGNFLGRKVAILKAYYKSHQVGVITSLEYAVPFTNWKRLNDFYGDVRDKFDKRTDIKKPETLVGKIVFYNKVNLALFSGFLKNQKTIGGKLEFIGAHVPVICMITGIFFATFPHLGISGSKNEREQEFEQKKQGINAQYD